MTEYAQPVQSRGEKPPAAITKRDRAKFLTQELKSSVRTLLRHDDEQTSTSQDEIFTDAAFDPQRALSPKESDNSSVTDRLSLGARTVVNTLKNPKAVSRNNYTRHAVSKIANHPHDQSTAFDDELLDAHDALEDAKYRYEFYQDDDTPPGESASAADLASAQARVNRIEQQRDDLKSGWILGRHVVRAKAVQRMTSKPDRSQFLVPLTAKDQPQRLQLGSYLGHSLLWYTDPFTAHRVDDFDEPPFDLRELALTLERLAAISTPWQTFMTEIREIYRWDNPSRTARIMVLYWVLWYFQQITTFAATFIIYKTISNKIRPTTVQAIRERVQRSRDQSARVRAWGELVQKHGGSDWVEPLLDGIGPHLQLQFGDFTTFLERAQNFYRWEQPQRTWMALSFWLIFVLFLVLASTQLCVQMFWLVMGLYFFYGLPIATRYPRYRHLVSPLCWVFWPIPDAAELAIDQLQGKVLARDAAHMSQLKQDEGKHPSASAQKSEQDAISPNPEEVHEMQMSGITPSPDRTPDPLSHAHLRDRISFTTILLPSHLSGNVVLTRTHIQFEADNKVQFSHPYTAILEIYKVDLNKNTDESSTANGTNKLSRTAHISRSLEKSAQVQLLPEGLGFVFLRKNSVSVKEGAVEPAPSKDSQPTPDDPPQTNSRSSLQADCADSSPHLSQTKVSENANVPSAGRNQEHKFSITFILNKRDRDKIFTVVLAWSGMKWQPLYSMNRQNKLGTRRRGTGKKETEEGSKSLNGNLDDAIKRALV